MSYDYLCLCPLCFCVSYLSSDDDARGRDDAEGDALAQHEAREEDVAHKLRRALQSRQMASTRDSDTAMTPERMSIGFHQRARHWPQGG